MTSDNTPYPLLARLRTALSLVFAAAGILLWCQGGALAQIKTKKADCYFEKAGQVYIDGTCEFLTDVKYYGVGGFRISNYDDGRVRYFAEVSLLEGTPQGTWNETSGRAQVEVRQGNLGAVAAEGACWVGADARICAWRIGQGRPGFQTGNYKAPSAADGARRPDPDLSRKTMSADCFFEHEDSVLINGSCGFETDPSALGTGGFRIMSYLGGEVRQYALVKIQRPGEAGVEWNTVPGKVNTMTALGGLKKDGACWTLTWLFKTTRVCAWKPGEGRPGFTGPSPTPSVDNKPLTSQGTTTVAADCYFEVDGQVPLDGLCRFMRNEFYGPGGFGLASFMTDKKIFLVDLKRKPGDPPGTGAGSWNGRPGLMQVATPVGELTTSGPCWVNERARICAWKLGEGRGDFSPLAPGSKGVAPEGPGAQPLPPEEPPRTAGNQPPERKGVRITLTFKGACEQLVIDGEPSTGRCAPSMSNLSVTGEPTAEFTFSTKDGSRLVFQGQGQGRTEGSALLQPIGAILLDENGAQLHKTAKGRCRMPDPFSGAVTIECDATTDISAYSARFQTDGKKPLVDERGP